MRNKVRIGTSLGIRNKYISKLITDGRQKSSLSNETHNIFKSGSQFGDNSGMRRGQSTALKSNEIDNDLAQ